MNDARSTCDSISEALLPYLQPQQSASVTEERGNPVLPALHTRLQKLLDTIPTSAQRQGLSLLDLQACLRGRKGGLPHIGEMGAAMRKLGWQRHRAWSDENTAFSSRWYPPKRG
jgi:hypothetical protein